MSRDESIINFLENCERVREEKRNKVLKKFHLMNFKNIKLLKKEENK